MPPQIALLLYSGFIWWLFAQNRKQHTAVSGALWIPLIWTLILASRPISSWFGLGILITTPDDYLEGSPFDRFVFLTLILAGLYVLWKRNVSLTDVLRNNKVLVALYLYWAVSIIWSDYPFVSLKRWIKDVGNVVMVLVILTERKPIEAIRSLFAKCTYLLIPTSVLFIKYFPD